MAKAYSRAGSNIFTSLLGSNGSVKMEMLKAENSDSLDKPGRPFQENPCCVGDRSKTRDPLVETKK